VGGAELPVEDTGVALSVIVLPLIEDTVVPFGILIE